MRIVAIRCRTLAGPSTGTGDIKCRDCAVESEQEAVIYIARINVPPRDGARSVDVARFALRTLMITTPIPGVTQ